MCTYTYITYRHMHINMCILICTHVHIYMHMHINIYIHMHTHLPPEVLYFYLPSSCPIACFHLSLTNSPNPKDHRPAGDPRPKAFCFITMISFTR